MMDIGHNVIFLLKNVMILKSKIFYVYLKDVSLATRFQYRVFLILILNKNHMIHDGAIHL